MRGTELEAGFSRTTRLVSPKRLHQSHQWPHCRKRKHTVSLQAGALTDSHMSRRWTGTLSCLANIIVDAETHRGSLASFHILGHSTLVRMLEQTEAHRRDYPEL